MSTDDTDATETVDRLLEEADGLLADADDPDDLAGDEDLQALAEDARSLFDDADRSELLSAVGLDVSAESGPTELLQALQEADTEALVRRRRLDLLSEVGDGGDQGDGSALEEFAALGAVLEEGEDAALEDLDGVDVDDLGLGADESAAADDGAAADDETDEEASPEDVADDGPEQEGADAGAEPEDGADEPASADAEDAGDEESDSGLGQHAGALKDAVDDIVNRDPPAAEDEAAPAEEDAEDAEEASTRDDESSVAASDRADMRVPPRHSTMPK